MSLYDGSRGGRWFALMIASGVALASACGVDEGEDQDSPSAVTVPNDSAEARAVAERVRSRFRLAGSRVPVLRDAEAVGWDHEGEWIRARLAADLHVERSARVALPVRASSPFSIGDEASGLSMHVTLEDAVDAPAETVDGYVVYRSAHASGADLVHRVTAVGTEDFLVFERAPLAAAVNYVIALGERVSGLRLVSNTLELVDGEGVPRLRVASPYLVDRNGKRHEATLAVEGCAVDTDPTAPHGRAVVEPGAEKCTVRVGWNEEQVAYPALLDPAWMTTGSMAFARTTHTASVLADGRVLVVGGLYGTTSNPLASAELYDPASATWTTTTPMLVARYSHSASVLGDGRVLIAGGNEYVYLSSCVLYDPATGSWSSTGSLTASRTAQTATVLGDGRVLVAGGVGPPTGHLATAELYDPVSETWSATPDMSSSRTANTATLLADGRVLVAGGFNPGSIASAELFDPVSGTWSATGSMNLARRQHTANLLGDGRVIVVGGFGENDTIVSVELYDPALGTWSATYPLNSARHSHTASLLADGSVMVASGSGITILYTAEIRDPITGFWSTSASLVNARVNHTASTLADGKVLVAGGSDANLTLASAELFDPAPVGTPCSSAVQCSSGHCVDGACCENDCAFGVDDCVHCGTGYCEPQDSAPCDDRDPCTQTDTCVMDVCTGSDSVVCTALDECHETGMCDPTSGVCTDPTQPDGTACTNGTCVSGVCINLGTGGAGGAPGDGGAPGAGGGGVASLASVEEDDGGCGIARPGRARDAGWIAGLLLLALSLRDNRFGSTTRRRRNCRVGSSCRDRG